MKKGCKIALVGGLAAVVGIAACWKWMIRMPLGEFTRLNTPPRDGHFNRPSQTP